MTLDDYQEEVIKAMAARGRQPNLSFFAFTATPKYKTLEVFGRPAPDGKPEPFHLYSMRQAIEEGFILDVLANYTTYKTYYGLIKSVEDDPEVEKKQAAKALARFMSLHPHNIAQKTEVMVEHFRTHTRHKIGGRAKAMVVTSSRLHAVRYKQEFDRQHRGEGLLRHQDAGRLLRRGDRPRPARRHLHRGRHEPGHQGKAAAREVRRRRLPAPAGRREIPDRLRPAAAAHDVRRQAARRRAGRADALAAEPHGARQGGHLRPGLRQRAPRRSTSPLPPTTRPPPSASRPPPNSSTPCRPDLNGAQIYYPEEVEGFCSVFFAPKATQTPGDHAKLNAWLDKAVKRFAERRPASTGRRTARSFAASWSPFATSTPSSRRSSPTATQTSRSSTPSCAS